MTLKAADPDFAHPKTTLDAAIKHYDAAISSPMTSTSGVTMIKSLLEIIGATSAIDPDSLVRVIPRVDHAIDTYSSADKALMLTVKAELLNSIYSAKRWTYDRMETPDEPLPDDITEWNGRQFTAQIQSVLTDAFNLAAENKNAKLADYKSVINADKLTLRFFPSVASFVASRASNLPVIDNRESFLSPMIESIIAESTTYSDAYFYWLDKKINLTSEDILSELEKYYLSNRDHEAAGYLLCNCLKSYSKQSAPQWAIPELKNFINRFPTYWDINALKNILGQLTLPEVGIQCKSIVLPGSKFDIKLNHSYSLTAGYKIYKIDAKTFKKRGRFNPSEATIIKSVSFKTDSEIASADTILYENLDTFGYYVIQPMVNGTTYRYDAFYFRCMSFIPTLVEQFAEHLITVVDYHTGAPIEGAKVKEIGYQSTEVGLTDAKGIYSFIPKINNNRSWYTTSCDITYGTQTFNFFEKSSRGITPTPLGNLSVNILTDRMLYHPGDTVQWAAIAYTSSNPPFLNTNANIHIELLDANYQLVDSITLKTNSNGRISGKFTLPSDCLTGSFSFRAKSSGKKVYGGRNIEVADFKVPTFKIDNVDVRRDAPAKGDVSLSSVVTTYSGMPVSGAKIEAEIWSASWWRWFSPDKVIGRLSDTTDANGKFDIIVNDSITSSTSSKCFIAKITVTSPDGESHNISAPFSLGKPYNIQVSDKSDIVNIDQPLENPFAAYTASGNEVSIAVKWWLTLAQSDHTLEEAVASGECATDKKSFIDFSNVPAGRWCLSVEPIDSTLADAVKEAAFFTTYSIDKNLVPKGTGIFVPEDKVSANRDGSFSITFGVSDDDTYVYQALASGNRLVSADVNKLESGFHTIALSLPKGKENGSLCLFTVRDGKQFYKNIQVNIDFKNKVRLECATMRDHLAPGVSEKWTIKFIDQSDAPQTGAMIATMFNASLNAIYPYNISDFPRTESTTFQQISTVAYQPSYFTTISADFKALKERYLIDPRFSPSINASDLRQYKFMARSATAGANSTQVTAILVTEDEAYEESKAVMIGSASVSDSVEEAYEEEGKVNNNGDSFDYRDSEVLQAFWMPELTFNPQGEAEISFTVPNANTTWAFNAFAWTADVRSAKMVREFVASKPVMVQPNLPRFLRAGDKARVLATVYNNSDSAAAITTVVEIFDITSGAVKSQFTSTDSVDAKASAIVGATVIADGDVSAIGYRVRSTLDRFTDGEQSFIPVIAATSDVIESENFYLNPGEATVEVKVPDRKNMKATLDYTANPAWNIIKELPGLATENSSTSVGASLQLFGAATAAGLLRNYPALAEVLKAWNEDPDSKALTSRLEQNDELKTAVLNSTPWVQAAAGDTERMARLSLLFDRKTTDKSIQTSIATLKKLQQADGGWSWGSWGKQSSLWSTNIVLQNLARLNDIGYLPTDNGLKQMISRAIAYYESEISKKEMIDYAFTYIVSMFPEVEIGLRGKQVVNATVQDIIGNWQKSSTWYKAIEAIILDRNEHKAVAGQIIGSLSEFAVPSADKGTSFPSISNVNDYTDLLYAFSSITPDSKIIDGMR
ncbi:MAG: hypothetical protein K2M54_07575, partial [Muribaculaceae bacterium]|nr:hypothetical protein [Muribaculaceae bacterium]